MRLFPKKKSVSPVSHAKASPQEDLESFSDVYYTKHKSTIISEGKKCKLNKKAEYYRQHTIVERPRWKALFLKISTITAVIVFVGIASVAAILLKYGRSLPDYYYLKHYQPPVITHIYDRLGNPLCELAEERRIYTHLSDIPSLLIRAFLSAEDKDFYGHCGIDLQGLVKAVLLNTLQQKWSSNPVGGSTITQQIAKIFLVGNEHSFTRKIKEAILAVRIENALSKDKILELYLNQIYLGAGAYGVASAALAYFHKPLSELTLSECAFLASLPKAPGYKTSLKIYKKLLDRRNWVLLQMKKNGVITEEDYEEAKKEAIPLHRAAESNVSQVPTYYLEEARKELIRYFGEKMTYSAGIEATLTIHPQIQAIADHALRHTLELYDRRKGWRGPWGHTSLETSYARTLREAGLPGCPCRPAIVAAINNDSIDVLLANEEKKTILIDDFLTTSVLKRMKVGDLIYVQKSQDHQWRLAQIPEVTGGMAVLDANTGEVLALSGGYDYRLNQFNGATQAYRQPGSAFKPFVYLAALNKDFREDSILIEEPIAIPISGGFYRPHNYDKSVYGGPMSLTEALVLSRNVFTVILAQKTGLKRITQLACRCGVCDYLPRCYSIVLGSAETTVLKIASAYASFFNGGYSVKPQLFLNITSPFMSCERTQEALEDLHLKPESLDQLKRMLRQCVLRGTAKKLKNLSDEYPVKIYGKTGTSNDWKDAWFVGCIEVNEDSSFEWIKVGHPLVFAVFVGHPIPKSLGMHETGSKVALPAAHEFIEALCQKQK